MKRFYLAYGSNLNVEQMKTRCPYAKVIGTALIADYHLLFRGSKTGSYLTIEPKADCCVPVAVWEVTALDEKNLDRYEGFPNFYYKQDFRLAVRTESGEKELDTFAYIMHENRPVGIPTGSYMMTCLEGYDTFRFDRKILMKAYKNCREVVSDEDM